LAKEFQGAGLLEAHQRFFREAQAAGRLQHPDIVQILGSGQQGDIDFIVMEYVSGENLVASARTLLPVPLVLKLGGRVAQALAYAHRQGVVHRDIKPANIMVDFQGNVLKITDFGMAHLMDATQTKTGLVLGTPAFMSPEQLAGGRVDGRSDLYSLGVMLYQLLTGHLPHQSSSMAALMFDIANRPAPDVRTYRPELPPIVSKVLELALQPRPESRYFNGQRMAADLAQVLMQLSNESG
jgi:eukaryotic-like serine/threonine-protein kinase